VPIIRKALPSVETVRAALNYDPNTGIFIWRERPDLRECIGKGYAGKPAGSVSSRYVCICIDGISYRAHRLAWLIVYGEDPGEIDHINGDKHDNRIANLRVVTRRENHFTQRIRSDNETGFKGVKCDWRRGVFYARIDDIYLGTFDTAKEAHAAYLEAKKRLHTFNPIPRQL